MKKYLFWASVLLIMAGCQRDPHFITDKAYRNATHADFEARMADFPMLQLQLDTLSRAEREAMEFLYAYMPLCDLADYEPAFFLQQVRYAFKAREEMPWGKDIPEDVFRHFVLVYRVNNENLDTARMVFFHELKERVKGMTMEEAALEVNHWCHEHVAYRAADARTSAPLATMRTSLGRCGEESTFTVTALRAVGIPARQCYTPRWAHCDDNHAWVEVYVADEWKYLGACEPSPRLNMAWFTVPSTRCMMVHTKAFGRYKGDEEVVKRTAMYSELNLLSHYAPTRRVTVTVIDGNAAPVEGAQVKFKLYNYAEYYTLATVTTDAEGKASLTTGLGDLLVWTTIPHGDRFLCTFDKIDVRQDSTLTLRTDYAYDLKYDQAVRLYEMVPPAAGNPREVATEEEKAANAKRLAYEDSLRNAYPATFPTKDNYKQFMKPNPNLIDEQAWEIIRKSESNYAEIIKFLDNHAEEDLVVMEHYPGIIQYEDGHYEQMPSKIHNSYLYDYICTFSDKDLRDITADILEAHWGVPSVRFAFYENYKKGILPARISNEMVRPYRKELAGFKGMTAEEIRQWTIDSITISDTGNYYNCPISPVGVYKIRQADPHSRDIFFVAACRAAGIPAYLDNAINIIYVWDGKEWSPSGFSEQSGNTGQSASLTLIYRGKEPAKPVYWPHFTIAKLENGALRTFDFEDDARMASFPATITLEPGIYCLSTGNRYPDGAVRSRLEFFEVREGEHVTKEIVILPLENKQNTEHSRVNTKMELFDGVELWDYAGKKGMLYINLGDYSEPSKHLTVELKAHQDEMKAWGGMTYMVVGPNTNGIPFRGLVNTDFVYNTVAGGSMSPLDKEILAALKLPTGNIQYPHVALIDDQGRILYHSMGYKIGVIEQVLKAIPQ